jgi:hypothetical protein
MQRVMLVSVLGAMLSSAVACGSESDGALEGAADDIEIQLAQLEQAYEVAGLEKPSALALPRTRLISELLELGEGVVDDEASMAEVTSAYASLSAHELDAFNLLRMQRHLGKLEATMQASSSPEQPQYEAELEDTRRLARARVEVNRLAVERHGKGSNAITPAQLDVILDEVLTGELGPDLTQGPSLLEQSPASDITIQACTETSFPSSASKREGNGPTDTSYWRVTKTGQDDCDWRFNFVGNYTRFDPENLDTELLMASFGTVPRANYQAYLGSTLTDHTRLLLGANRVWFWCGGPNGVNLTMN